MDGVNLEPEYLAPGEDTGPFDDFELPDLSPSEKRKQEREKRREEEPSAGPPRLDEWQHFFATILIKGLSERYIDLVFAEIDENTLSQREYERIYLAENERNRIAKPFSELANKLKFTRKHGRVIIAASGTLDSVITIGMWLSRVNRIAERHRPANQQHPSRPRTIRIDPDRAQQEPYVSSEPPSQNGTNGTARQAGPSFGYGFPEAPGTG